MKRILQISVFVAFAIFVMSLVGQHVKAQVNTLQTTIGSVPNACVGDTVSIPVTVTMGTGISVAAISLSVDYDTTKLLCLSSVSGVNSNIATGFLSNCGFFTNQNPNPPYSATSRRQFRVAWFNLVPVAFNGLMFNMRFVVLSGGNSAVQWDLATAGNCEYADEFADVITIPASGWVNGSVTAPTPASIIAQPSATVTVGEFQSASIRSN
ncbi:MAG: cohesin domain-containing protein [Bacteroidota bacterium]